MERKIIINGKLKCSKCNLFKPLSDFYNTKKFTSGKYSSCKSCHTISTKKSIIKKWGNMNNYYLDYRNRVCGGNPSIIYSKKKCNARENKIEFNMSRMEFIEWYNHQKLECFYCGIKQEDVSKNKDKMPNINIYRLTLDRLNPIKGYQIDNIVLACSRCNLTKNDFFTPEEMKEIGGKYVRNKWK